MGGMGMMGGMGRMADANGDRALTRAEFEAAALKHFATADADNDGRITAAERDAAMAKIRAARAAHAGHDMAPPPPAGDDND